MDWRKVFLAFAVTPQLHTNTGRYKGAIKMLEEHLDRSILWIMCRIFYAMEALTGQKTEGSRKTLYTKLQNFCQKFSQIPLK